MGFLTDDVRNSAIKIMADVGNPATRVGRGQRWVVKLADGKQALVKTAGKGGLMSKAASSDPDSKMSGFGDDVSHVLCAVGNPEDGTVTAYLIPIDVVEEAFRRCYREWLKTHPNSNNTTWVIHFPKRGLDYYGDGMAEEWSQYRVGTAALIESRTVAKSEPRAILDAARADIAEAYGVEPDQVTISVNL